MTLTIAERLEDAMERIRDLEAALRPAEVSFFRGLNPTHGQRVILEVLLHAHAPLGLHALRLRMNIAAHVTHEVDDDSVEIAMSRLRKRLASLLIPIVISRMRGEGFYLDVINKARLSAIRSVIL
jgi:hypothetical protein